MASRIQRSPQVLALGMIAALLGGQLAGLAHDLTTRHVRCAEHGELIDAGAVAGTPAASPTARPGDAATPAHGHEHCLFAVLGHHHSTSVAAASLGVAAATIDPTTPPPTVPRSRGRLFLLAPKTSPPV